MGILRSRKYIQSVIGNSFPGLKPGASDRVYQDKPQQITPIILSFQIISVNIN